MSPGAAKRLDEVGLSEPFLWYRPCVVLRVAHCVQSREPSPGFSKLAASWAKSPRREAPPAGRTTSGSGEGSPADGGRRRMGVATSCRQRRGASTRPVVQIPQWRRLDSNQGPTDYEWRTTASRCANTDLLRQAAPTDSGSVRRVVSTPVSTARLAFVPSIPTLAQLAEGRRNGPRTDPSASVIQCLFGPLQLAVYRCILGADLAREPEPPNEGPDRQR